MTEGGSGSRCTATLRACLKSTSMYRDSALARL